MSRITLTSLQAQIDGQKDTLARIEALLGTPAKRTTRKTAAKRTTRKTAAKKVTVTKGSQAKEAGGLTSKDWNRTLTAKARLAGKNGKGKSAVSFYSLVLKDWGKVQAARTAGATPDEVLATFTG